MRFRLAIEEGEAARDADLRVGDLEAGDLFKIPDRYSGHLYIKTDEADWNAFNLTTSELVDLDEDVAVAPYRGKLTISKAV